MTTAASALVAPLPRAGRPAGPRPWSRLLSLAAGWVGNDRAAAARTTASDSMLPAQQRWAGHRAALYARGEQLADKRCSLVVFEQVDLPELIAVFGARPAQQLLAIFGAKLKLLAGSEGLAVRADAATWALLLPGADAATALAALKRTFGKSLAVEAEADGDGDELLLVPRIAIRTLAGRRTPLRATYRELCEEIRGSHARELRRQDYLRRERESHSRPAPLSMY